MVLFNLLRVDFDTNCPKVILSDDNRIFIDCTIVKNNIFPKRISHANWIF